MLIGKGSNCFFKRKRGNQLNLFSTTLSPGVRETYFAERVEKDAISFFWSFWIIFACREGLIWRLFQRERDLNRVSLVKVGPLFQELSGQTKGLEKIKMCLFATQKNCNLGTSKQLPCCFTFIINKLDLLQCSLFQILNFLTNFKSLKIYDS